MFSRLPESNAKRQRRTGGFVVSTVVHLTLIALAVRATGLTAAPRPTTQPKPPVYVEKLPPHPTPKPAPVVRGEADPTLPPTRPDPIVEVVDLGKIPDVIPDADAMNRIIEEFATSKVAAGEPSGSPNVSDESPLPKTLVERAVVAIPGTATPRYPSMLQSAGIEGDVRAQFVVDTLGRVEQGSFKVLESTHDLFANAVRDALSRARFKPAEVGGRRVRQLVEQTFTFRITR